MPDQRKEGKKKVGAWMTPAELQQLVELAKATGLSQSDLIKEAIDRMAKVRGLTGEKKNEDQHHD